MIASFGIFLTIFALFVFWWPWPVSKSQAQYDLNIEFAAKVIIGMAMAIGPALISTYWTMKG